MNALAALLLASALVLRSGDRIMLDEPPRTENGIVVFRSAGLLYSMPANEIDEIATQALATNQEKKEENVRRLRVSDDERKRLLAELEKNHSGTAMAVPEVLRHVPPPEPSSDAEEWDWRRQARGYEENVRQAREELGLIQEEVDRLRREIQFFFAQGFKPHQFTWQTTRLAEAMDRIPRAELDVQRAERAYEQFREDARKQGVMPGWLR